MKGAMPIELNPSQKELTARARDLAQSKFAPRAAEYDRAAAFPEDDFKDLFHAGLLVLVVPPEYGGLGLGPYHGNVLTLWLVTKEIAKADLALTRCWEGHVNSLVLLDGIANEEQKKRWFNGVVQNGDIWVAWSGEPQARASSESTSFGTTTTKVEGGYIVDGKKAFDTSAGSARFIPEANLIGSPGQYLLDGWQTCFIPHYASTFLGAAEAAYEFALDYVTTQGKAGDPYIQHHIGQSAINVETAYLWLQHVARMWDTGRHPEAQLAGSRARHIIEHLAEDTVKRCIRACGARSLNRPSPLERIYRDLSFYVRHDNDDHILATVGKSLLGQKHDPSFYKP